MNILKRPMFFAAVACSIIAAVSLFSKTFAFYITIVVVLTLLILIAAKKLKYITVLLAVLLFTVGLVCQFANISKINALDGEKIKGDFIVMQETVDHGEYNSIILKELNCNALPKAAKLLTFDYEKTKLKTGDVVNVTLHLSAVDQNDKYWLSNYSDSVYAKANVKSITITKNKNRFFKATGNIRAFVKKTVSNNFKSDTAGLLVALTTGDKTLLSDEFLGNVKTTGISHVIVVSGMHLAIIMTAVYFCLDRLFYNKYIRCALSIALVIAIYSVCGFTMSITRAGAMFIVAGLAPIFNRENDSLSSLSTAITAVLIATPFAIVNISFLLSVLSTLAIIWVMPFYYNVITDKLNIKSKIIKSVLATALCSLFAIVFTLPVTIKTFGFVSVVASFTNLIINIPVTIELVFNVIALLFSAVPAINFLSYPMFWVAGICSRFTVFTVNTIAKLPITVAVLPQNSFWWSVAIIGLVIGYMYFYNFKKKRSDFNANSTRG